MRRTLLAACLVIACRIPTEQFPITDAPPCGTTGGFGSLRPLNGLDHINSVVRFSPDELTAYFAVGDGSGIDGPATPPQLYAATRASLGDDFSNRIAIDQVNTSDGETTPAIDPGGLAIYYTHDEEPLHPSGSDHELYRATRSSTSAAFGPGSNLEMVSTADRDDDYANVDSQGDLWFSSNREHPILSFYRAPNNGDGTFGVPVRVMSLDSTTAGDYYPVLTTDRLQIVFSRRTYDATSKPVGPYVMFVANRTSVTDTFGQAQQLYPDPVLVPDPDDAPNPDQYRAAWISPDNCRLYVVEGDYMSPDMQAYVADRLPP